MAAEAQIDIRVNTEGAQNSLDKFQGAIDTLGGSVEVVFGSLALFGVENQWIQNLEQGAVGAIALADGAKRMTEGIIRFTGATTLAEAAQAAFNTVAKANPYVLLGVAILGVATALYTLTKNSRDAAKQAEELQRQYKLQQAALDTTGSSLIKLIENENQLNNLRKSVTGQTQQQLLRNQKRLNDALEQEGDRVRIAQERYIETSNLNKQGLVGIKNVEEALAAFQQAQKQATDNAKFYSDQLAIVNGELDARASKTDNNTSSTKNNTDATDEQNEALKKQAELIADAIALEDELYLLRLSAQDREETEAQQLFDERVARANGSAILIKQAEEQLLVDLAAIRKKYAVDTSQQQQDLYDELYALSLADQDRAELEAQQVFDDRVAKANGNAELIKMAEQQLINDLNKIRKEGSDKAAEENQKAIDAQLAAEQSLYDAKVGLAYAGLEVLKAVGGENEKVQNAIFAAEKALAIGEVVVNLVKEIAANNANPTWSLLPDGGAVIKATANTAAKIRAAAQIASIAATTISQFRNGGGGGVNVGSTSPGFTLASNVNANTNQQTTPPNVQAGGPIQAYVLAGDVTDGLEAQQKLNSRRTL